MDAIFDALQGWFYFWNLDISPSYLSFLIAPEDRCKTAVLVPGLGLVEYVRMVFGLQCAPAFFTRQMHCLLDGGTDGPTGAQHYLDDVIGGGPDFQSALRMLRAVFRRVRDSGMLFKAKKCFLFKLELKYLGHVLTREGLRPDPAKVSIVIEWPIPHNPREILSFCGLAGYYLRFQKDFATLAAPLRTLTRQGVPYEWTEAQQTAFDAIKRGLTTAPVLAPPQIPGSPLILTTDASAFASGAILSQEQSGAERVIAYHSRQFSPREKNFCAISRELLSLVIAVKVFHQYLISAPFVVKSDAQALQWLRSFKHPEGKIACWIELLAQYTFTVLYQRGATLTHADALSRYPTRPCPPGCKTCQRLEIKDHTKEQAATLPACLTRLEADTTWSPAVVRAEQLADFTIGPILAAKERGTRPTPEDAASYGSSARVLWALQWDTLFVDEGVLFRRFVHPSGNPDRDSRQLVLPYSRVHDTVREYHALPRTGSHFKQTKTLAKVRERFYWPMASQDVRNIVAACEECCRVHGGGRGRHPGAMQPYSDTTFLGRWFLDLLGPYPPPTACPRYAEAAKKYKKWFCLVTVESFTGWPEVMVVPNGDSETCARAVVEGIVSRFGAPREIHSDQGQNWEAYLFKDVMELLQIRKTRTSGRYPRSNGRCERFIRTLVEHLAVVVRHDQRDWPSWIPLLLLAYRTAPHYAPGISPSEMLYGRILNLPSDLAREPPPNSRVPTDPFQYPEWLSTIMRRIHDDARTIVLLVNLLHRIQQA